MNDVQLQAICFYLGGSWVYDALHDMPEANKRALLAEFIATVGQEVLDETIEYVKRDHADPMPQWLIDQLKR